MPAHFRILSNNRRNKGVHAKLTLSQQLGHLQKHHTTGPIQLNNCVVIQIVYQGRIVNTPYLMVS